MKLSHVKIKRRRARRVPTQYPPARHDPPFSKAAQPLVDAGWEWKHGEGFVPPPFAWRASPPPVGRTDPPHFTDAPPRAR